MSLGNTQEAIPFKKKKKKDSLNHIPTHFVIRLDSKSILKPGPLDSSNPRSSSLNIPAHMNHSNSWLLEGISCPALLLFLLTPLLKSWAGTRPSFDLDPEGDREEGLAKLRDRCETKRVTEIWDVSGRCLHTQTSDLVRYPSKCNISGGPYSNGNNLTPSVSLP